MKNLIFLVLALISLNCFGQTIVHKQDVRADKDLEVVGTTNVDSINVASEVVLSPTLNGTGLGAGAIFKNGFPYIFTSAENETYPNFFAGLYSGGNVSAHGTGGEPNDGGNVGIGTYALSSLGGEGYQNMAIGGGALAYNTLGDWNVAIGSSAMFFNVSGGRNTAIGRNVLSNMTSGEENTVIGKNAALRVNGNSGDVTTLNQGVYIGADTEASASGVANEIVIGYNADGSGANTATIGNASITSIKAGADYTAVDNRDLVTKGYADATYMGGGGTIGGTIADNQIAVGNGVNAIDGSSTFTWNGSWLGMDLATAIRWGSSAQIDFVSGLRMTSLATGVDITLTTGTNGNVDLSAGQDVNIDASDGRVKIEGLSYPNADGTANQVMTTDGLGNLTFSTPAGGGIGGSIADNQIAVGASTADDIEGSSELTYNSGSFTIAPASGASQINMNPTNGQGTITIQQAGDYDMKFELLGTGDYSFYAGGSEKMNIDDTGNVSISGGSRIYFDPFASGGIYTNDFGSVSSSGIYLFQNDMILRSYDGANASLIGQLEVTYDDFGGLDLKFNDLGNSENATLKYLGFADGFLFEDANAIDFGGAELSGRRMNISTYTGNDTVLTGELNKTWFYTGGSAGTITIPDTLTEGAGTHITIFTEGAGAVTIAVTGTATLNGVTAGSIDIAGQYKSVTVIQRVAESDDWVVIGAY